MSATIEARRPRVVEVHGNALNGSQTRPTVEARILSPLEAKADAAAGLHNSLVMTARNPLDVPSPARIDRDFRRIAARATDKKVNDLVMSSVGDALAATVGQDRVSFVHQIGQVTDTFVKLREGLTTKKGKETPKTVDAIIDSLDYLQARGYQDATAVDSARELLFSYALTTLQYHNQPEKAEKVAEVINEAKKQNSQRLQNDRLLDVLRSFGRRHSTVVDTKGVHSTGLVVYKFNAPEADVAADKRFERDGATSVVELLMPDGEPVEYAVSMLVKDEATGKWRKVHLAPPLTPHEFDPNRHVETQQSHIWTTDIPSGKQRYAIVAEATPWYQDKDRSELGTIHAMFQDAETEDGPDTSAFLSAIEKTGMSLSAVFGTSGMHEGQVYLKREGAQQLLKRLAETGNEDILDLPLMSEFQGKETFTRFQLSFATRVGTPGSKDTMPLSVHVLDSQKGSELITSFSKPGEPKSKGKRVEPSIEEQLDRDEIAEVLGIDGESARSEIFIVDTATTERPIRQSTNGDGEETATRQRTRPMYLQPLVPHESGDGVSDQKTMVEVVPYVGKKRHTNIIRRAATLDTVGDMLRHVATAHYSSPQVRIQSEQLADEIKAEEARVEAERARVAAEARARLSSLFTDIGYGGLDRMATRQSLSYAPPPSIEASARRRLTGATTVFGEEEERGESHVGTVEATAQLPAVQFAAVSEMEVVVPPGVKDKVRRLSQV